MDTRKNPAKQASGKKAKAGEAAKSAKISGNRPSSREEESEDEEKASEEESGKLSNEESSEDEKEDDDDEESKSTTGPLTEEEEIAKLQAKIKELTKKRKSSASTVHTMATNFNYVFLETISHENVAALIENAKKAEIHPGIKDDYKIESYVKPDAKIRLTEMFKAKTEILNGDVDWTSWTTLKFELKFYKINPKPGKIVTKSTQVDLKAKLNKFIIKIDISDSLSQEAGLFELTEMVKITKDEMLTAEQHTELVKALITRLEKLGKQNNRVLAAIHEELAPKIKEYLTLDDARAALADAIMAARTAAEDAQKKGFALMANQTSEPWTNPDTTRSGKRQRSSSPKARLLESLLEPRPRTLPNSPFIN